VTLDYLPFTTHHSWRWSNSGQTHVKAKAQQAYPQYQHHHCQQLRKILLQNAGPTGQQKWKGYDDADHQAGA
jgi:hypothetical protein